MEKLNTDQLVDVYGSVLDVRSRGSSSVFTMVGIWSLVDAQIMLIDFLKVIFLDLQPRGKLYSIDNHLNNLLKGDLHKIYVYIVVLQQNDIWVWVALSNSICKDDIVAVFLELL